MAASATRRESVLFITIIGVPIAGIGYRLKLLHGGSAVEIQFKISGNRKAIV